jgi:protein phosphatase
MKMGLVFAGKTDVGRKREHNEDSFYINEKQGLFAIADGMGGHAAGEVASRIAVDVINEFIELSGNDSDITWPFEYDDGVSLEENRIFTAIKLANTKIFEVIRERKELEGMGTTLVIMLVRGGKAYIGHVGDSRAYLLRKGELRQVTSDHSWVNEQMKLGVLTRAEAANHPFRNVVTRALGGRDVIKADVTCQPLEPGDVVLMCSDGLNSMLEDERIRELIATDTADLPAACERLVAAANDAGGDDNCTVILARATAEA